MRWQHQVLFVRKFSAAHRLPDDGTPCERIHGHNYKATIFVRVNGPLHRGMVVHANKVKGLVDEKYDHRLILFDEDPLLQPIMDSKPFTFAGPVEWIKKVRYTPTTENLALIIAEDIREVVAPLFSAGNVSVDLDETETISAHCTLKWGEE